MEFAQLKLQQQNFLHQYEQVGKSQNSLKCYRLDFECLNQFLLNPKFAQAQINFDQVTLESFEQYLSNKYPNANSVRRKLQTLRLFFDYLVREHSFPENPIKKLVSRPKQLLPPAPNFMPDLVKVNDYLNKRIAEASTSKERLQFMRNQILFILIYQCGLSVSQLGPLERSHFINIDTDSPRVTIHPPRRGPYTVPINGRYASVIRNYFAILSTEQMKDQIEFPQIFFNSNSFKLISGGISPRGIEDIFKRISSAAGVAMTPKSLRQSAVFRWLKEKHPLTNIKEWMGVAPSYNFSLYAQYANNRADEVAEFGDLPIGQLDTLH